METLLNHKLMENRFHVYVNNMLMIAFHRHHNMIMQIFYKRSIMVL